MSKSLRLSSHRDMSRDLRLSSHRDSSRDLRFSSHRDSSRDLRLSSRRDMSRDLRLSSRRDMSRSLRLSSHRDMSRSPRLGNQNTPSLKENPTERRRMTRMEGRMRKPQARWAQGRAARADGAGVVAWEDLKTGTEGENTLVSLRNKVKQKISGEF
jgi:hypothetical protein